MIPQRMQHIYQMLFEMASGNFSFRIGRSDTDDELESLILLVNMAAEEMKASIFHYAYINPRHTYHYVIQHTFILDEHMNIDGVNDNVAVLLGIPTQNLYGKEFSQFLTDPDSWKGIERALVNDSTFRETFPLTFRADNGLTIPSFCTVSRLLHCKKTVISSATIVLPGCEIWDDAALSSRATNAARTNANARTIQQLHDYILQNLDAPLPTIRALARKFGSNTYTLKSGFRHFFNTSIYQFYNDERLKRAHLQIQQTNEPLLVIAELCGFNTYPNFSKAFRKKFGYSAVSLRRRG
jgi:AraC-like DNA-binding protein